MIITSRFTILKQKNKNVMWLMCGEKKKKKHLAISQLIIINYQSSIIINVSFKKQYEIKKKKKII